MRTRVVFFAGRGGKDTGYVVRVASIENPPATILPVPVVFVSCCTRVCYCMLALYLCSAPKRITVCAVLVVRVRSILSVVYIPITAQYVGDIPHIL